MREAVGHSVVPFGDFASPRSLPAVETAGYSHPSRFAGLRSGNAAFLGTRSSAFAGTPARAALRLTAECSPVTSNPGVLTFLSINRPPIQSGPDARKTKP